MHASFISFLWNLMVKRWDENIFNKTYVLSAVSIWLWYMRPHNFFFQLQGDSGLIGPPGPPGTVIVTLTGADNTTVTVLHG